MQARSSYLHGSINISTHVKRKPRKHAVWELRYRLPSGKQSDKILGKAWLKSSRPPAGFMTRTQAEADAQKFLDENANSVPDDRKTFARACQEFIRMCEREKDLRGSTIHEYQRMLDGLAQRHWRKDETWSERPIDTFTEDDLMAVREEMIADERSATTINHYRRVIRGVFGTKSNSAALVWTWMAARPDSAGKLRFYDPSQVRRLKEHALSEMDSAIYTLATEAGPRMSEIRGLKVGNVDFEVGRIRFEDGYTTRGGHAGTKGRRVRSVPMSDGVRAALWPYCTGRDKDELVFQHPQAPGEPICDVALHRHFKSATKRAELPQIRFHDLRHSFGTRAIRAFTIFEVQTMMGHASIATTQIYLHYAPDPDAASRLTKLWAAEPEGEVIDLQQRRAS